ncbi:MAG: Rne/Rng family ribonuclease, partial [Deltaproteobacteria bacterium]
MQKANKLIVVNAAPYETRVATLESGILVELLIERGDDRNSVGNIYNGKVIRVLPGMQAAFVDIGMDKAGFLFAGDFVTPQLEFDSDGSEETVLPEDIGIREARYPQEHFLPPIEGLIREGQHILVQVAKEPLGTKGARITSHVSLPGRYLVLMPTVEHVGVSRKIVDEEERRRLKTILKEFRQERGGGGLIARTAGQGREAEAFLRDGRYLSRTWDEVRALASRQRAPVLLYREPSLIERLLRDLLSDDVASVRLDNEREFQRTLELVQALEPALAPRVRLHQGPAGILEEHGVSAELERALRSKVWLPAGGYIVINQTEALVAIDVN